MHLPAADAPPAYFEPAEDLDGLIRMVRKSVPGVIVFREVGGEKRSAPAIEAPTGADEFGIFAGPISSSSGLPS